MSTQQTFNWSECCMLHACMYVYVHISVKKPLVWWKSRKFSFRDQIILHCACDTNRFAFLLIFELWKFQIFLPRIRIMNFCYNVHLHETWTFHFNFIFYSILNFVCEIRKILHWLLSISISDLFKNVKDLIILKLVFILITLFLMR